MIINFTTPPPPTKMEIFNHSIINIYSYNNTNNLAATLTLKLILQHYLTTNNCTGMIESSILVKHN